VTRRQRLSATQIAELFDPPTEQRELIRHYTLSAADLAAIARRRGDHNRLGHALMRCYLRYPGRPLRVGERPPAALLTFVADQIGVFPDTIDDYLATERNRQRHALSARNSSDCVISASGRRRKLPRLYCRRQWKMIDLRIWPPWSCRPAVSSGSSRRRRAPLNGCVASCATRPAGKCIAA
jgi:hypothetical protein